MVVVHDNVVPVKLTVKATIASFCVPAKGDVHGHLVDLPLVRETVFAGVGEKLLTVVVRIHGILEARGASLQAYMSLRIVFGGEKVYEHLTSHIPNFGVRAGTKRVLRFSAVAFSCLCFPERRGSLQPPLTYAIKSVIITKK